MRARRLRVAVLVAVAALLIGTGVAAPAAARTGTAAIKGQVLAWMDPIGLARVTVFNARTGAVVTSQLADVNGDYLIGGLPAISVRVKASKAGYLDAWAGVYTLQPGQTLEQSWDPMVLYLDLTPEAVATGVVKGVRTGRGTPCVTPLRRARVTVVDAATGVVLGSAVTNGAGSFRVGKLPAARVKIKAAKRGWVTTWAPMQPTFASAQDFELLAQYTTDAGTVTMTARGGRRARC